MSDLSQTSSLASYPREWEYRGALPLGYEKFSVLEYGRHAEGFPDSSATNAQTISVIENYQLK